MLKKFSLFLVLLAGIFWGSTPLFINYLQEVGFDSFQCTLIKLLPSSPIMFLLVFVFDKKLPKLTPKLILYFALIGICSVLAMCTFYYYSIMFTTAAVAAVLQYTAPIFVMIMSVILFKEKITVKKIICLILTVVGCCLTAGILGGFKGSVLGVLLGLLAGFSYSLYGIISTFALREGATPFSCTAFSFIFATIGACFISNPITIIKQTASLEKPLEAVAVMLGFSICTSVIAYSLYTLGLLGTKPDVASIMATVDPIVSTLIGVFFLSQPLEIAQRIGIILVFASITALNIKFKSTSKKHLQ